MTETTSVPATTSATRHDDPDAPARRVAIASEIVARVDALKLRVRGGRYFQPDVSCTPAIVAARATRVDLAAIVDDLAAGCDVCAVGAAIMVAAGLYDRIPTSAVFRDDGGESGNLYGSALTDLLKAHFEPFQVVLIETAFERRYYGDRFGFGRLHDLCGEADALVSRALNFDPDNLEQTAERLRAIYENVIDNGGTFIP